MATEPDKIIWRQILAPLKLAVKSPSVHLIHLLQDSNGSICFEQECWTSWSISDHNKPKISTNTDIQPTQAPEPPPSSDNLRESLLHHLRLGEKCKLLILETTITHQVGNKNLPPKIYISMKAEKVANSILFVSSPGLSMGHVLWITALSRILHLASCILLLLFVLGC